MKHLAVFYTNNKISPVALKKSLSYFAKIVDNPNLPFETLGVIVSISPLFNIWHIQSGKIKNIIAPNKIINKGHLSIIEKILLAVELFPSDFISLHEHDVLYPEEYLLSIQNVLEEVPVDNLDYLAYNNLLGVNKTGYQKRKIIDFPLSTLTFKVHAIKDLLKNKLKEYYFNDNWCYLEPGYAGSYGNHLKRVQLGKGSLLPAVHINMNETSYSHHLSNHYLSYEPVSHHGFNEWPGDLSYLFD